VRAFACNQRDEARDLHNVSAALCAYPGMKQQAFITENCLTPWDTQQTRVFTGDGASPTLAGADGGGGRNPGGLVFAAFLGGAGAKARSIGYSEAVSPTLKGEPCGFSSPCVCEPGLARTLTASGDASPCADRGQNVVAVNVPAINRRMREGPPTLPSGGHHSVAVGTNQANPNGHGIRLASGKNVAGTLMANAGTKMWLGNQEAFGGNFFPIQSYIVRRLTPTECERLQGFPDGWTAFGHDGRGISDTRRYQMLGNSVAVPCVAFILGGIAAQVRSGK
jgi:hypothetical protein